MIGILVLWSLIGFLIWAGMQSVANEAGLTGAMGKSEGFEFINPLFVYKYNKVNWFGALVVALLYSTLCPIGTFCYWFYKICTVGRKD